MGLLTFISFFREEHRRRKKSCPFFSASAPALTNRTGSQSQSTKPPSKSKPPTRSTSKSKHQDVLLPTKTHDGDPDDHSDSSRSVKRRSRSKSVTRSEPEGSNPEGEIKKKMLRSKSKTRVEDSEDVPRKSSRFKAKASKGHEVPPKPSRTRSKTKVFESEPEEEPLTTIKPRSTSQPEPRREVRIPTVSHTRETDVVGDIEPEPERNDHVHPAPSTSQRSFAQTPPKVLPALSKPNNPLPSVPAVSPIREIDGVGDIRVEPEPEPETNNHVHPAPSTSQRSLPQTLPKEVLSSLSKPNNPPPSVPTASSIPGIDVVGDIETDPETKNHVYPAPSTSHRSFAQTSPKKVLPAPSKLLVQPNNPVPSVPAASPIREIDVVADIAPEFQTNNHVDTVPSTPQWSLPQTPPKKVITSPPKAVPSTTVELIPALSKLPSIPLHTLTEAELDMTVEEWIRYQMDVEYDKFRRDGERELLRFRNQAEEVRKAIEGL